MPAAPMIGAISDMMTLPLWTFLTQKYQITAKQVMVWTISTIAVPMSASSP